jgi:hypothetical protein
MHDSGGLAELGSRTWREIVAECVNNSRPRCGRHRTTVRVNTKGFFRGLARLVREFRIEIGPIRAQGPPAILVAVTGVVLASGVAAALARSAPQLPETLREANVLARTLRGLEPPRLNS